MEFELGNTLYGHRQDVKSISVVNDDLFASVGRDSNLILWKRDGSEFTAKSIAVEGDSYLNAVAFIKGVSKEFAAGFIACGGSDSIIRVFALQDLLETTAPEPRFVLSHTHTKNVCFIADASTDSANCVISCSWDNTAVVWMNWSCQYVLQGHEEAVWCAVQSFADRDVIITGSADLKIKMWRDGKCINTLKQHHDCVRTLVSLESFGFASGSNDASVRLWSWDGDCLATLSGHSSFIYSMCYLRAQDLIVSSAEDRTACVFSRSRATLVQRVAQPCVSVWAVAAFPNGDFVVGGSDSMVRVFTQSKDRVAPEQVRIQFKESVANQALSRQTLEDKINIESLPGKEALLKPGAKEGQVIMIRGESSTTALAYQWSSLASQWEQIGEVVDAAGQDKKSVFAGKEYDYVFDVDLGDGEVRKLPHNAADNPYTSAQNFITNHELSQDFLDQIAKFIMANSSSSGVIGETAQRQLKMLPVTTFVSFKTGKIQQIEALFSTYAKELGDYDETRFQLAVKALSAPVNDADRRLVAEFMFRPLINWPKANRLPAIDAFRLIVAHTPLIVLEEFPTASISHTLLQVFCDSLCIQYGDCNADSKLIMLALRAIVNVFPESSDELQKILIALEPALLDACSKWVNEWNAESRLHEFAAVASLILNYSILHSSFATCDTSKPQEAIIKIALITLRKLNSSISSMPVSATIVDMYKRVAAAIGNVLVPKPSLSSALKQELTIELSIKDSPALKETTLQAVFQDIFTLTSF